MSAAPSLSSLNLRSAAARFPKGVALVTAPGALALVVDSFVSVSLEPPLIAIAPARSSWTWKRMRRTGRIGVNVLGAARAADVRARAHPAADRLAGLDVEVRPSGVPALRDALAFIECELETEHPAGDHTIAVARVLETRLGAADAPLVFFGGAFGTFAAPQKPDSIVSPRHGTAM
jgi:3-hydroxy-9,10-secoandrosta-1,3,5(10)-triene-9,17-dione monooxygenase reductase component